MNLLDLTDQFLGRFGELEGFRRYTRALQAKLLSHSQDLPDPPSATGIHLCIRTEAWVNLLKTT